MYGKVFKKFRKDKGFTIQEVADDYVSRTAISRFERDEAELSFSKVLHILEQIGVSLVEFNLSLEIGPSNDQGRIARMMVEKNLAGLEEEIQKRVEVQQHSSNKQRQLVLIMLKHQYNELSQTDKFPLDIVQVSLLTDYLFACENWAYFELVLFGNTIALYETKTVLLFSEELIKRTVYFQQERTYFETFLNMAHFIMNLAT